MSEEPTQEPADLLPHEDDEEERSGAFKIGAVLFILVGAIVALLLTSDFGDAFVYSKRVHEVMADPSAFVGQELKVEGDLQQGSIRFREDPCEWRFVLTSEEQIMAVRFPECVVPDTFRDDFGIQVTVQGQLQEDGTFLANEVIPRCPSKYEMNERLQSGEEMPHADPTTLSPPTFDDEEEGPEEPTP